MDTKPQIPADEILEAMGHEDLGKLLVAHGVTEDELKTPELNSKDKRRAAFRAMAGEAKTPDPAAKDEQPVSDPSPLPQGDPGDETQDVAETIDTAVTEEPREPRPSFREHIAAAAREAHKKGDHARHAALHNFEMAAGDFHRAAKTLLPALDPTEGLADHIRGITEGGF